MAKVISSLPGSTGILSRTSQLTNDGESGVSTYVELDDISTVATTGDYNNLINVPINFTPKVHTHNISDISGTKSEFNTSLTDGDFLFVGDVLDTPDATTTSKGVIKLAGDLAGTADAPTVPGLANKVDKVAGKSLIADAEITRLTTLSNYTHPTNHPPSVITQDASNRFVSDAEKTAWNAKQGALGFTPENVANKQNSLAADGTGAKYATVDAISNGTAYKRTIAQIRDLSGALPNNNFYTTDKGQEGNWYYDSTDTTTADNTGTVLVTLDGKRIKRVISSELNVKWFGAKGDSATDDKTFIQNTIAEATVSGKGVFIPSGTYRITGTLTLNLKSSIRGEGRDLTILKLANGAGSKMISLSSTAAYSISLSDFTLDANKTNNPTANGNTLDIVTDFGSVDAKHIIERVTIKETRGTAMNVSGRGDSTYKDILILECVNKGLLIDCWDSTFTNIVIGHCQGGAIDITKSNNRLIGVKVWGSDYGINDSGSNTNASTIDIQDCYQYGLRLNASYQLYSGVNVDAIGYNNGNFFTDATAILITSSGAVGSVQGSVRDRSQFSGTGSLRYALECLGNRNRIDLTVNDVLTGAIKNELLINKENIIKLNGTLKDFTSIYINRDIRTSRVVSLSTDFTPIWMKFAEITSSVDGSDFCNRYLFTATDFSGAGQTAEIEYSFKIINNVTPPIINVRIISLSEGTIFNSNSFKIVQNGYGQPIQLWLNGVARARKTVVEVSNSFSNNVNSTYFYIPIKQTPAPTGTYEAVASNNLKFGSQLLLTDAPSDGKSYLRKNALWTAEVNEVALTSSSNGVDYNAWTKVASINFGSITNSGFSLILGISGAVAHRQSGILLIGGYQTTAGNAPTMYATMASKSQSVIDYFDVLITNNGFGDDFTIYIKKKNLYGGYAISEISKRIDGTASIAYFSSQPWEITDPSLTYAVVSTEITARLASPAFTGTPTAPTAAPGTNTTQIATTAFVAAGLATKVNSSGTVNTIPKFTGVNTLDNSSITDTGSLVSINNFIAGSVTRVLPIGATNIGQTINVTGANETSSLSSISTINYNEDTFSYSGNLIPFQKTINLNKSTNQTNTDLFLHRDVFLLGSTGNVRTINGNAVNFGGSGTGTISSVNAYTFNGGAFINTYPITTFTGFNLLNTPQNNVINAYGFRVGDLYGTTISRAIDLSVSSGVNKYNVYAGGTAKNYFNGNTLFGTTTDDGVNKLQVNGSGKFSTGVNVGDSESYSFGGASVKVIGNAGANVIDIQTNNTSALFLSATQVPRFTALAGTGTRNVVADASGNLSTDSTVYAPLASPSLTGTPTAPTAPAGTNTTQIATTAFVQATKPYKVYTALLSQTGTNAPVATVLENTLGGTVVWTRTGVGTYIGTLTGAFISQKTWTMIGGNYTLSTSFLRLNPSSLNAVSMVTESGGISDNVLEKTSIEIRVYN